MTTKPQTEIRVQGPDDDCQTTIDTLGRVLHMGKVRGPYRNRSNADVRYFVTVTPRRFQHEPGA